MKKPESQAITVCLMVWDFCFCRKFFCRVLDIRVAESVGVDMGQAVAVREVIEPVGDTVRVHVVAVVLGKDIAGMNPAVTIGKLQPELFPLVLPEQLHGFAGSGSKRQSPVLVLPS